MQQNDIVITQIHMVMTDTRYRLKPYIPVTPRKFHALAYVTSGNLLYTVGEKSTVVRQGEIIFVRAGKIDLSEVYECESVSYITIDFNTLSDEFVLPTVLTFSQTASSQLFKLFEEILQIWRSDPVSRDAQCFARIYTILSTIFDEIFEKSRDSYRFRKLSPAIEYINKYCLDPGFDRTRLAELSNMSAVNLNRLFKEFFGVTVGCYINKRRMDEAKTLLMNSSNTISEIAIKCGFADIYSFSHSFHRNTGLSPTEWRKK